MLVAMQDYLRDKRLIPADRYLRTDAFGTPRTQERRRPARTSAVSVQKLIKQTGKWKQGK